MTSLRGPTPKPPSHFGVAAAWSLIIHGLAGFAPAMLPPVAVERSLPPFLARLAPARAALPAPVAARPTAAVPAPRTTRQVVSSEQQPAVAAVMPVTISAPVTVGRSAAPELAPVLAPMVEPSALPVRHADHRVAKAMLTSSPPEILEALAVVCHEQRSPTYPVSSRRRGEEGKVILRVDLDARGMITGAAVVSSSGSRRLDEAALAAVHEWKCRPASRDGLAIPATAMQPFSFVLQDG